MTTLVLGIGNVLMHDDGIGPYAVLHFLAHYRLAPGTRLQEAGTPGLDLTVHLAGCRRLVVVDAVRDDGPPGTVRIYDKETILRAGPIQAWTPHDPGLREALMTLDMTGGGPEEVVLVGVLPQKVETGTGLTPPVAAALPHIERALYRTLEEWGVSPTLRTDPETPHFWWE